MKKMLFVLAFVPLLLFSQSRKQKKALEAQQKEDQQLVGHLKSHLQHLSGSAKMEDAAAGYISSQFKLIGLQPKGSNGYVQQFKLEDEKQIDPGTYLKINGTALEIKKEFIPLSYSATKPVTGMPAIALREKGVPWFLDVKDLLEENSKNTGFDINEAVQKEAARVAAKGATALFIYNSGNVVDNIRFNNKDKFAPAPIPVLYMMPDGYKKYLTDQSQMLDIELNVAFNDLHRNGNNVVGYIDNGAPATVVIGARYDKADAEEGTSEPGAVKTNTGVVENAGEAAMLIELARMLSASKAKKNNYLFIAFDRESIGSAGSNYWLKNATVSTPVNFMINLNMINSNAADKKLLITGTQTSPRWAEIITKISGKSGEVSLDSSSVISGSSAMFYQKEIPALTFFTAGYPGEGMDKINYQAEVQLARFIGRLIETTDALGRIAFTKSAPPQETVAKAAETAGPAIKQASVQTSALNAGNSIMVPKTSVSLGIISDKSDNPEGLRISGVSPKRLASKIGLQSGDILTYLGSYKIADMKSYLQALANFKAGDKTVIGIKRGKEDKEFAVEF